MIKKGETFFLQHKSHQREIERKIMHNHDRSEFQFLPTTAAIIERKSLFAFSHSNLLTRASERNISPPYHPPPFKKRKFIFIVCELLEFLPLKANLPRITSENLLI
jgi:hypothetical protein